MTEKKKSDLGIGRRGFLKYTGYAGVATTVGLLGLSSNGCSNNNGEDLAKYVYPSNLDSPFTLGVASGDPNAQSVVLWTRLAPDPLNGGGMPESNVMVRWIIATDENLQNVVEEGYELAKSVDAHSVHVTVNGLQPDRWYYYGFVAGDYESRIGRTRTLPTDRAEVEKLSFTFITCQEYEFGYYAAFRHMADEDLDFVVHLGDYIYEGESNPFIPKARELPTGECFTLEEYRNRYALYQMDEDLQAAQAACPFIVVWDDHEVSNDWASMTPANPDVQTTEEFMARRAVAAQAFYEHIPFSKQSKPRGPDMDLYRKVQIGDLATIFLLDTRQYRSDQPCGTSPRANPPILEDCIERYDSALTMTGDLQESWLFNGLQRSRARWNIIASQTWFSPFVYEARLDRSGQNVIPLEEDHYNTDCWDGYPAQRQRILDFIAENRPSNVVIISGDWHVNGVADVLHDYDDPGSEVLAAEFCGTAISSIGPWTPIMNIPQNRARNPHLKYLDGDNLYVSPMRIIHGYVTCHLTANRWITKFRVCDNSQDPNSDIYTAATFMVKDGTPGAELA